MKHSTTSDSGPRYLNQIGKEADDSRTLVEVLCNRVIRPYFDEGRISGHVDNVDQLILSVGDITRKLIKDAEWEEVYQKVCAWRDSLETCTGTYCKSPLTKILQKVSRFPTINRVTSLLGEEVGELYSDALEKIEADRESFAEFPTERINGGWNKHSAERAASLVIDVIAPHGGSPESMAAAYVKYMEECRAQTQEKRLTQNMGKESRKSAAKSLGIWLPMPCDFHLWETDPRTCDFAVEFERLANTVMEKMRVMRSVLQYTPKRRFSSHTIADAPANMARMRAYMKDIENREEVTKKRTLPLPVEEKIPPKRAKTE